MHDVGKQALPRTILSKPGALTASQRRLAERHPLLGPALATLARLPYEAVQAIRYHHDAWDGSDYPDNLSGDATPFGFASRPWWTYTTS